MMKSALAVCPLLLLANCLQAAVALDDNSPARAQPLAHTSRLNMTAPAAAAARIFVDVTGAGPGMAVPASVVARNTNTSSATSRGGGGRHKAEGGKTNRVTRESTSKERPAEDKKGHSLAQTSAKASQLNNTVMTPPESGSGPAAGRQTYLPSFAWESFFSPSTTQTGGQAAREMRDERVAFIQNTTGLNNTGR